MNQREISDGSLLAHIPEEVGPRKMTYRGGAVHWRQPAGSRNFIGAGHSTVIMLAPAKGVSFGFEDERPVKLDVIPGMLAIRPAGVGCKTSWDTVTESVIVGHAPDSVLELAGHEFDRTDIEPRPTHLTLDNAALQFAQFIKAELHRPEHGNELYLDSLITSLTIHILRHHSNGTKPVKSVKGGLSAAAATKVRDYMHEHFSRKLTLAELAAICGVSPGHFAQTFARTFGVPPHRYLVERRLDFAEKLLCETEMSVSQIAFVCGFSSQSHLTNIMRNYRQKTPHQLRSYA
ncbi:AraC family transcriptional regulator [Agrobacterium pusense]|uniref:AraC family transcriptional regulator n=1 Tax=Agrobacterium pusense TaxID=648995 RepID=UPI0028A965EF|nr:AraC family transcriptional regulator [Agrobacterium pusense]